MKEEANIATHAFPVWRERADFIIAIRLGEELGIGDLLEWEQLWARKLTSNSFELCCIPFFAYDLALGDIIETSPFESKRYVINKVLIPSGHRTFRVFFQSLERWSNIIDEITSLGCTVEARWKQSKLIAVDAASETECDLLKTFLIKLEKQNMIAWENGN